MQASFVSSWLIAVVFFRLWLAKNNRCDKLLFYVPRKVLDTNKLAAQNEKVFSSTF